MAPKEADEVLTSKAKVDAEYVSTDKQGTRTIKILWKNVLLMSFLHIMSLYTLTIITECHWKTLLFAFVSGFSSLLGVTAGAHRLWTHRSYKAKLPLRIFLMLLNSLCLQNSIFDWTRDHRTHHKYTETDADPHNVKRGFFFAHVGWLLVRKHPDVARKGKAIPLDDLYRDPVVVFQRKYYIPMAISICFVIPTLIPWLCWNEGLWNSYCMCLLRYCAILNFTWSVNSFAHMYGDKPYDKTIHAVENKLVALLATGEGFHNFHHTFPHDYATSEYGIKFNLTTLFLDTMALLGQVYDRRSVSKEAIEARQNRTGKYSSVLVAAQ